MTAMTRILAVAVSALVSLPLQAAPRVFIGPAGNDANACTLPAPCRTFQRGIDAVDAGGEVVVLDSAGYGAMTINKAVSANGGTGIAASGLGVLVTASGNRVTGNLLHGFSEASDAGFVSFQDNVLMANNAGAGQTIGLIVGGTKQ